MNQTFNDAETEQTDADRIVYVRPVNREDLPDELQAQTEGFDNLHSVHAPDGQRLALVRDRRLAFALARQNNFAPVSVH